MSFVEIFKDYSWNEVEKFIYSRTAKDVELSLSRSKKDFYDFCTLISPVANNYLEDFARLSSAITRKRFGNTMQMYIPLYLSNECSNVCTYCGFSKYNKINRKTLNHEEILKEVEIIKRQGFQHVLLVTGESRQYADVNYLESAINLIKPHFSNISIEVQPLETNEYLRLKNVGTYAVLVYQETYDRENYKKYHLKGKKSNFEYRLDTPDRVGSANLHKLGLGVLLGLSDWRVDASMLALHLQYLEKKYWQTKFSISFPRLRPAEGVTVSNNLCSEKDLVQLITAFRIFNENVELSLSTRESPSFRDNVLKLGITTISAGSSTEPGGYANKNSALKQFEIHDDRDPNTMARKISVLGFDVVWKDWESSWNANF
jgi:2-iminoacetate synthase